MPNGTTPSRDQFLAYNLFRAFVGLDFFGHGYARIFTGNYLQGFAEGLQKSMAPAPLAPQLVLAMGYVIPCVELLVGILLLLGLLTRFALVVTFGLMFVLMFGVTMKQDWATAGQQIVYGLALFALLYLCDRFPGGWRGYLRWREAPRPVPVPPRVPAVVPPDTVGPLGRS